MMICCSVGELGSQGVAPCLPAGIHPSRPPLRARCAALETRTHGKSGRAHTVRAFGSFPGPDPGDGSAGEGMLKVNDAARETPDALRSVVVERANYTRTIREMRWSAGPVFLIAAGASVRAARSAALAMEYLLGWPAVAHSASTFLRYSVGVLQPRSTLIVVSPGGTRGPGGNEEDLAAVANEARRRGASVLALTDSDSDRVARAANAWVRLPCNAGPLAPLMAPVAEQAALFELAIAAARILNPRNQLLAPLEAEFEELPGHAARMHFQLAEPLRACARSIAATRRVTLAGAGFFDAAVWRATRLALSITSINFGATEVDFAAGLAAEAVAGAGPYLLLSTARSRNKQQVHTLAAELKAAGARLLAVTSGNDGDLIRLSEFAVLTPEISEIPASVLSLIFLEWLILESASA